MGLGARCQRVVSVTVTHGLHVCPGHGVKLPERLPCELKVWASIPPRHKVRLSLGQLFFGAVVRLAEWPVPFVGPQ